MTNMRCTVEWLGAFTNKSSVTSRYDEAPPLDPFPIYDFQLDTSVPCLNVSGYLPRLPDRVNLPQDQIPDRAALFLAFMGLKDLKISGIPDRFGGSLEISRLSPTATQFAYESKVFRFSGICSHAVLGGVMVLAKFDVSRPSPSGPKLFSHHNVWNTCLLLLKEFGYSLQALGHPANRDFPAGMRWRATKPDGTSLTGNTPIELLGLAALHRYHNPDFNAPYWWHIDGPSVTQELIDDLAKRARFVPTDGDDRT